MTKHRRDHDELIRRNVKKLMGDRGMTQADLAERAGYSEYQLKRRLSSGGARIHFDDCLKLAKGLGVRVFELVEPALPASERGSGPAPLPPRDASGARVGSSGAVRCSFKLHGERVILVLEGPVED